MGGAAGHMSHPFDDKDLTFKDLKKMIEQSFEGDLKETTEKLDGQNLMISYKKKVKKNEKKTWLYQKLFVSSIVNNERNNN